MIFLDYSPSLDVKKTAALYIRVSTHSQEELSPDSQRRLLLDYAAAHQMEVPEQFIYEEKGISGRRADKRPRFQEMIAAAKSPARPFQVILVWKYSRFARNQEESIVYKSMLRSKCGVEVVSISEPLADGPFGSLIERIIEWMDEFYSIRLSGDVKRGMTEKAIRGGSQCRPPFGYRIPYHNGTAQIVPEEGRIVKMIFEKYVCSRISAFSIARQLNEMGLKTSLGNPFEKRAVEYILSNPFYAGEVRWNRRCGSSGRLNGQEDWIIKEGAHPPLISKELFQKAQERMAEDKSRRGKHARPEESCRHWLSGLLKCPYCGCSLSSCIRRRKTMDDAFFFQCSGYLKGKCPHNCYFSETALVPAILQAVEEAEKGGDMASRYEAVLPGGEEPAEEICMVKSRLKKICFSLNRARDAYLDGVETKEGYRISKNKLENEKKRLEDRLAALESPKETAKVSPGSFSLRQVLSSQSFTNAEKNAVLKGIVTKIVCYKEEAHIDIYYDAARAGGANHFPQG